MRVPGFQLTCEDNNFHVQCQLDRHADTDLFLEPSIGAGLCLCLSGGLVELRWPQDTDPEHIVDFLRTLSEQAVELAAKVAKTG